MTKHICIINRWSVGWDSEKPDYEKIMNHNEYKVSYIVDAEGNKGLSQNILENSIIELVEDINSLDNIRTAFEKIEKKGGSIDRLIALSEWDILNSGKLRDEKGLEGLSFKQALNARDKVKMKEIVSQSGLRTPKFSKCDSVEELEQFINQAGFPIVIKPRRMAASKGVHILHNQEEYDEILPHIEFKDLECEEYCEGTVFHVDGLVKDNQLKFCIPFRYINPPIKFFQQSPLGSVSVDKNETMLYEGLIDFTQKTVNALGINNTMFHLELIVDEKSDKPEPIFMEIGARMGGADIPRCVSLLIGRDAVTDQLKVELGEEVSDVRLDEGVSSGYLLIPFPAELPCLMEKNTSFKGKLSTLVEEYLRSKGEVLDGSGGYLKIPARYIFKGETNQVYKDVMNAIKEHQYEYKSFVKQ
ncbi:ATP-grasp domain-containing protein [Bacillus siamensis]|uniref:ATP-grasp domain-containing protein n=1 Tax=Bacillus siamensis TaxID=659243 RepID=UPI002DBA7EFA|nr:hypothetical protein [Bacillus siamensis]MEC3655552.1 ATP-grasp domain-containing protein [Bacillus siamensis]